MWQTLNNNIIKKFLHAYRRILCPYCGDDHMKPYISLEKFLKTTNTDFE